MSLFKASILVSGLSLCLSLISFVNQVVIANYFGTGSQMDMYLIASSYPLMISGIISSALSFSLIPHFIKKEYELKSDFKTYFLQFIKIGSILLLLTGVILLLGSFFLIPNFYSFEPKQMVEIKGIIIVTWGIFILSILFAFFTSFFNAKRQFFLPLMLSVLPFLLSIIFTIFFSEKLGIITIAIGICVGYLVAIILSLAKARKEIMFNKDVDYSSDVLVYFKKLRYPIYAMLSFSIFQAVDAFWAPNLGESALSYLGYSQRLIIAIGALVIIGPSTVLIPRLTTSINEGRMRDYYYESALVMKIVLALTSVMAVIVSMLSAPIIKIMFQRGEFSEESTQGVSDILPYMLTGMVFMLTVVVVFRAVFVRAVSRKVALIGLFTFALYFILSGLLSAYFSITGIGYAYILTWVTIFSLSIKLLFGNELKVFLNKRTVVFAVKQIFNLILIYFLTHFMIYLFEHYLDQNNFFNLFISTIIIGLTTVIVYGLLSLYIIQIAEIKFLGQKIHQLFCKKNKM
jgi:putative peptidoglycan lipid II flippase